MTLEGHAESFSHHGPSSFSDMAKETEVNIEIGGSEPLNDLEKNHVVEIVSRWVLARMQTERQTILHKQSVEKRD